VRTLGKQLRFFAGLVLALVVSSSTWFYMNRVLREHQLAEAAAHDRPRGNLSDLYPRWLGARELLLHGRNPYGSDIAVEIQRGYYGRPIDPSRPYDPKDEQGFAYPAYVVFLLAPTVRLPFNEVQIGFRWLLISLTAASVLFWLHSLRWKTSFGTGLIFIVLMLGWLPVVQAIKLQQLSLVVAGLLSACGACLAGGWLFLAGALLALSTIKPQLAWPLVLWLFVWAGSEWSSRRKLIFGFALVMLLLLCGAELVLPHWLGMFVQGISRYHQYTQNQSVLTSLFGMIVGRIVGAACILACAVCLWEVRKEPASEASFGRASALVLALTVVIVPMSALYNEVLLAPAVLVLLRSVWSRDNPILPAVRRARAVGFLILAWPWIATIGLSLMSFFWLTPELRDRLWPAPLYPSYVIPVFVFGLALLDAWGSQPRTLRESTPAE
jgi:Glycosyltransferase family 87